MKAMVLGMGLQGKAVIHDLETSDRITDIFVADMFPSERVLADADAYLKSMGYTKTTTVRLDVAKAADLPAAYVSRDIDVVVCMLPIQLALTAATAALHAGVPFVSSNYTYDLIQLDALAKEKNGIILPEMGLDPGIDLILGRLALDQLDTVHGLYSYGGGVPPPAAAGNSPIKYKISWIFDRVLDVYVREARQVKNGRLHVVPGDALFKEENVHEIEFSGIGTLEAYPNGDSARYVGLYGLDDELQEMGRFALRWTGHARFWHTLVALGLLDDAPVTINQSAISPRAFIAKCLSPKLQYEADEQDMALLRVQAWGVKNHKKTKITYDLIAYRDLQTGLFAMNRTVGFTSSIGALMILDGRIAQTGVLSPVRHVPPNAFLDEIQARGFQVSCKIEHPE